MTYNRPAFKIGMANNSGNRGGFTKFAVGIGMTVDTVALRGFTI